MKKASNDGPTLEFIKVEKIDPNPKNPRGPHVRERDKEFEFLLESIAELGVLVPLVVSEKNDRYLLVDGERRYHAAKEVRLDHVPAYVLKEEIDERAFYKTMFHIHQTRKQWDAAQQCEASQEFYDELVKQHGKDNFEILAEEFASFTGTSKLTARNRISFLRWPKDIKEYVYEQGGYWYVVEIEDKIIRPALQNYPEYFEVVDADDVRRDLFKKYRAGLVKAAVEVRVARVVASHVVKGNKREKAREILKRLIHDTDYLFSDARDEFVQQFPEAAEKRPMTPYSLVNAMRQLAETLKSYSPEYVHESTGRYSTDPGVFKNALEELAQAVQELLEQFK